MRLPLAIGDSITYGSDYMISLAPILAKTFELHYQRQSDACMEEALQKLRESVYYTGNQTLTFTNGSCQIHVVTGVGNSNRTVQTTGTLNTIQRKVKVVVTTVHPTIVISSWLEVADF